MDREFEVKTDRVGREEGLSVALHWLADAPLAEAQVLCLGMRLVDFSAAAWREALDWLSGDPAALVSTHEIGRATRFVHDADAVRHLLGRSLLRHVFARHHVRAPAMLPANAWGKPQGDSWLQFNLSHAGSEVWLACSNAVQVGIDVEVARPDPGDLLPIIHRAEAAALRDDRSATTCRRLWTRKEAIIKAAGEGLSLPLDAFQVALDARPTDWLITPPPAYPEPWSTHDVPAPSAGVVALAARGHKLGITWKMALVRVTP
jgi:4'-phosphopantetheinyl transferase